MTKIDAALRERLLADTAVAAIVGTRIYYDELPPTPTLPAIRLAKVSDIPHPVVPGRHDARIQCSCYTNPARANGTRDPSTLEALASAVAASVHTARLEMDPTPWTAPDGTKYSVVESRVANAPRFVEPVSGYLHAAVDALVQFKSD